MSVLQKIVDRKRDRLASARYAVPLASLKAKARDLDVPRDLRAALDRKGGPIRFITEIKKASPSKGMIRQSFDPLAIAASYQSGGANALSVITEEDFFQGDLRFLPAVKHASALPILRKDFLIDEYQIYEARANEADAVLLIAAILEKEAARDLLYLSSDLGMAVLFEVHDGHDLDMALELSAPIIGINNRSLRTLDISLGTTLELKKDIPADRIVVSESGIRTRRDVLTMEAAGVDALLVGTCLMESPDIGSKLADLRGA